MLASSAMNSTPGTSPGSYQPGTSHAAGTSQGTPRDESLPGLSVPEAAAALGVSANTIRRWIKDGTVVAERVPRPQGYALRVHLPTQVPAGTSPAGTSHAAQVPPNGTSHEHVPGTSREVPAVAPADLQRAEALAIYGARLLEPVVAELKAAREHVAAQAEELGRVRAELAAAQVRIAELEATPAPRQVAPTPPADSPVAPAPRSWWARWWPWG
jgi:excisionase family DNA binding protein